MELHHEKNLIALSKLLNVLLLVGFVVMTTVSIVLGLALNRTMNHQERTLVPPTISQAFTISGASVDAPYLQMMGEYFLFLKLNVTPANVSRQYSRLLDYVPPEKWAGIQPLLLTDATQIQKSNISSRFDPLPGQTHVSLESMQIKQKGQLIKTVGDRELPAEEVTYIVQMAYDNGLLELHGIMKEGQPND